jgi:hypothetical protein
MGNKFVTLVLPLEEEDSIEISTCKIPSNEKTIYDACGFFEDEIFPKSNFKCEKTKITEYIQLRSIINLHDEDGIDVKKIRGMAKDIYSKKHIFSEYKIPNIKLVKLESNELVVFDGHHTLLSYISCDKKYLHQIPHIIITNEKGSFKNQAIKLFLGKHSKKLKGKSWRDYVINWNVPFNAQLSLRKRKNIGEVFDALNLSETNLPKTNNL